MKSIKRLVLSLLVVWLGALCVIILNPRTESPSIAWEDENWEVAPARPASPAAVWSESGEDGGEPAQTILASAFTGSTEGVPEKLAGAVPKSPPTVFVAPELPSKTLSADEAITRLLRKPVDLTDPLARQNLVAKLAQLEAAKMEETKIKALALGYPLRTEDGAVLAGFEGDHPLYDIDHNVRAAISTGADLVHASPYNVDGSGFTFGLWEAGDIPRATHDEFQGRVAIAAGQTTSTDMHASHVAGTLAAAGVVDPLVKGMAPGASVIAHDANSEISEMTALAAAAPGDPGKVYLSNHSYGYSAGWGTAVIGGSSKDVWYGTYDSGTPNNSEAYLFGRYSTVARNYDDIAWDAPYYLIVKSAGNDRNDSKPTSGTWYLNADINQPFDFSVAPPSDHGWMADGGVDGFGTVGERSSAKNILAVGSVTDAVSGGVRNAGVVSLNSFSSAGPTDDGRIKPDLVANGNSLKSCDDDSDTDTATASGTSMSSPNACGSTMLLIDYYDSLYPGAALRSSMLKALLLHTADDLGKEGPDYRFGWGLMNVEAAAAILKDHHDSGSGERFVEGQLDGINTFDEFTFDHDGSGPVRITICWTDPAGTATSIHNNTAKRLVHDLNLSVSGPVQTHLPYVMPYVTGGFDNAKLDDPATTGVNDVDNVEQVYIKQVDAPAGSYTIRVDYAGALAQNLQEYSLVVSGAEFVNGPLTVSVENPVDDLEIFGDNTNTVPDYADVNDVFSAEAVSFEMSVSPSGIINAVLQGDGTVDITPTGTAFGTATVTLTATDAGQNEAQDDFDVTITSPVIYVDGDIAEGAFQDGNSWVAAFKYLQDALLLPNIAGREIWVAEGYYYPDKTVVGGVTVDTDNRATSFVIPAGVSVYGGFAGGETSVSEAQPLLHNTNLSGDIEGVAGNDSAVPGSYADGLNQSTTGTNSYIVVNLSNLTAGDAFDGFIVSGGYAVGTNQTRGGGIYSNNGSALISRCLISGNYGASSGGGAYFIGGAPTLIGCVFRGNLAGPNGGAMEINGSAVTLIGCELRGNEATSGAGAYIQGASNVNAVNCIVSGGKVGFFGPGGIEMAGGDLTLTNCTLTGNRGSLFTNGGALYVAASSTAVKVNNCIIWNNFGGGSTTGAGASIAYATSAPHPEIRNSLVANSFDAGNSWVATIGDNHGGNIDVDPEFVAGALTPDVQASLPDSGGDFTVLISSPTLGAGNAALLPLDALDLDEDANTAEAIPYDILGGTRVFGSLDLGPYEQVDPNYLDTDLDGISDGYELAYSGTTTGLNPTADLDGDGLDNLTEFALGHHPGEGISGPVGAITSELNVEDGQNYLTITYEIDDEAVHRGGADTVGLVTVVVERRTILTDPDGWAIGDTTEESATPIEGRPGMLRIVEVSNYPIGYQPCEFLRLRVGVMP